MTKNQDLYRKQLLTIIHTDPLYKEIKRNEAWQDWLDLRFGVKKQQGAKHKRAKHGRKYIARQVRG